MGLFSKVADNMPGNSVNKDYVNAQNGNALATATPVVGGQQPGAYAVSGPPPDLQYRLQHQPQQPQQTMQQQEKSWFSKVTGAATTTTQQPASVGTPLTQSNMIPITTRGPVMVSCCPSCQQETRTTARTYPTMWTWIACVVLFIVFWPLCWVPLVLDHVSINKCNANWMISKVLLVSCLRYLFVYTVSVRFTISFPLDLLLYTNRRRRRIIFASYVILRLLKSHHSMIVASKQGPKKSPQQSFPATG